MIPRTQYSLRRTQEELLAIPGKCLCCQMLGAQSINESVVRAGLATMLALPRSPDAAKTRPWGRNGWGVEKLALLLPDVYPAFWLNKELEPPVPKPVTLQQQQTEFEKLSHPGPKRGLHKWLFFPTARHWELALSCSIISTPRAVRVRPRQSPYSVGMAPIPYSWKYILAFGCFKIHFCLNSLIHKLEQFIWQCFAFY